MSKAVPHGTLIGSNSDVGKLWVLKFDGGPDQEQIDGALVRTKKMTRKSRKG